MAASPSPSRPHRLLSFVLAGLVVVSAAACSSDDGEASSATTAVSAGGATGDTTDAGPAATDTPAASGVGQSPATASVPPPTYVVPSIPATQVPEICAGATLVADADEAITNLLGPPLQAEDGPEADSALLDAISRAQPSIEMARQGYDRMAAVLPAELASDATAVRDATLTIYGEISKATSVDDLVTVVNVGRELAQLAAASGSRLNETTKAVCNGLELSK